MGRIDIRQIGFRLNPLNFAQTVANSGKKEFGRGWLNLANWWLAWSSSSSSSWSSSWWMIGLGQLMIGMIIIVMIIIIIMMMDDWTRPIDDQQTNSFWNKETFPGVKHVSHRSIMILSPSAPLLSRLQILCRTKKEPWIILGTISSESYKLYQDS